MEAFLKNQAFSSAEESQILKPTSPDEIVCTIGWKTNFALVLIKHLSKNKAPQT